MRNNYNQQFRGIDVASKIEMLNNEMKKLEEEYKKRDPSINIADMYNYLILKDRILFSTTPYCASAELENRMRETAIKVLY